MKRIIGIFILVGMTSLLKAQQTDSLQFETFDYVEGDTTYHMKKYYLCIYHSGDNRDQSPEEAQKIQVAHQAHLEKYGKLNKICMAGPFQGHEKFRGLVVYSVYSLEEAQNIANMDPAVVAGRLVAEIIPFWAAKGSQLF